MGLVEFYDIIKFLGCGFLVYSILDAINTRYALNKHASHPLVGGPSTLMPKWLLNIGYAWRSTELARVGYEKYRDKAFQLMRSNGPVVVLPVHLLDEVARIPHNVAESTAALEQDLLGQFTGVDLILESRLHHSIVQRKLTPRLTTLLPQMEEAATAAFDEYFPQSTEWTEFMPYQALAKASARLSAGVIVGPEFADNEEWLHVAIDYTENLFRTVVILRMFPSWMHPLLARLHPSYWAGKRLLEQGKRLLGPKLQTLLDLNDAGKWQPDDTKPEDLNVLSWLAALAKGRERTAETIGHVLVLVALATVHTTLLRMVNVLYDVLSTNPELQDELLAEIAEVAKKGWHDNANGNPYDDLHKLDSVLRESQRMSPPTTMGMKRLFKQDYTFADGTHVRAGTYACMPVFAVENDPAVTPNPEKFDGLRAYRERFASAEEKTEYLFSSPGPQFLNFGYGKTACPGRFFASVVVKMVTVKALTEYEFKFKDAKGRPQNLMFHEFLFTWPWTKMLVRKKEKGQCPF
ncbi:cytochrome P450 [Cladorrhinum sp. PSN259]|nr:cytochrome P450 [Cladorrhinum sp. PSN259]